MLTIKFCDWTGIALHFMFIIYCSFYTFSWDIIDVGEPWVAQYVLHGNRVVRVAGYHFFEERAQWLAEYFVPLTR